MRTASGDQKVAGSGIMIIWFLAVRKQFFCGARLRHEAVQWSIRAHNGHRCEKTSLLEGRCEFFREGAYV
jgi:hypothetical protein